MFFKKKRNDLIKCKALVCSADLNNCDKIRDQLYSSDKKGFNLYFWRVDTTRFALEAKKMLRKNNYDLLIMDATMDKSPTIQIISTAKKENPNLKAIVLTPTLNFEIKQWKEVGSIDGFQLIPYQLIPFLKNVSDIVNGVKEKVEPIQETPLNLDLDIEDEDEESIEEKIETNHAEDNKEGETVEENDVSNQDISSVETIDEDSDDDGDLGIAL